MRSLMAAISTFFLALVAMAQTSTGTLTGLVSDTSKAPVGGVSIQAKNVQTGKVFLGMSAQNGNYSISQLPPGTYELSASSFGFKPYKGKDIVIQAGQTARADIPIGDFISLD